MYLMAGGRWPRGYLQGRCPLSRSLLPHLIVLLFLLLAGHHHHRHHHHFYHHHRRHHHLHHRHGHHQAGCWSTANCFSLSCFFSKPGKGWATTGDTLWSWLRCWWGLRCKSKTLPKIQRTQGIEYFDSSNNFGSKQKLQEALKLGFVWARNT